MKEGEFSSGILDLADHETRPSNADVSRPRRTLPNRGATCQPRKESFTAARTEIGGFLPASPERSPFIRHEANAPSGGKVTDIEIGAFLSGGRRKPRASGS